MKIKPIVNHGKLAWMLDLGVRGASATANSFRRKRMRERG